MNFHRGLFSISKVLGCSSIGIGKTMTRDLRFRPATN